jgi:hypothetical protein
MNKRTNSSFLLIQNEPLKIGANQASINTGTYLGVFFSKILPSISIPSQSLRIIHKNQQLLLDILRLNSKTLNCPLAALFESGIFESK